LLTACEQDQEGTSSILIGLELAPSWSCSQAFGKPI